MKGLILICIALFFLSGCGRNAEQDVETILASELLESYGIAINRPQQPYHFIDGIEDLRLEVALYVRGEYGIYYFTPGGWNDRLIAQFVRISEDGIRFAKDWLGYTGEPLIFIYNITEPDPDHPFPIWGGGGVLGSTTYISMSVDLMPSLIVHEAVHAILRRQERQSNFPQPPETSRWGWAQFLEEGLCDVIDFLFFMETEHNYDPNRYRRHRRDIQNHLHHEALNMLRFHNNFEDEAEFGHRYPKLMSNETAASFIYFLLEHKGSVEDFMRVFEDIYLMEEVFGESMEDMIVVWLTYLERFK